MNTCTVVQIAHLVNSTNGKKKHSINIRFSELLLISGGLGKKLKKGLVKGVVEGVMDQLQQDSSGDEEKEEEEEI